MFEILNSFGLSKYGYFFTHTLVMPSGFEVQCELQKYQHAVSYNMDSYLRVLTVVRYGIRAIVPMQNENIFASPDLR